MKDTEAGSGKLEAGRKHCLVRITNCILPPVYCLMCIAYCLLPTTTNAWGFYGHKLINKNSVFLLPPGMFGFYKANIEFITEHSVDPDRRRYSLDAEACRHYIDLDHYEKAVPIDSVPHYWKEAVAKFTADSLNAHGIVPWHINLMYFRLVEAFKNKDKQRILRVSAEIGHYIADAHVPLHTTHNYNGQFTNQHGIHAFWESRLPELFSSEYDLLGEKAVYIDKVQEAAWMAIEQSYAALDSVLTFEKILSHNFPDDRKYSFEDKGRQGIKNYSEEYSRKYNDMLNDQVERRLRASANMIASVWYSAWADGGMPDLDTLPEELPKPDPEQPEAPKQEKMIGRQEE